MKVGVTVNLSHFHSWVLFIYVVLTFESVDEILSCYHSNETSSAVLSHDTIYLVCNSNRFESVDRPVTRGGARGAFAPSPQAPKDRILILNIQVKECSRLN